MEEIFKTIELLKQQVGELLAENNQYKEALMQSQAKDMPKEPVREVKLTSVEQHEDDVVQKEPLKKEKPTLLF